MSKRIDAHMHIFEGGFAEEGLTYLPGITVDEATLYESFMQTHDIEAALVVGYAGGDWCSGNNTYIAKLAQTRDWIRPTAYLDLSHPINTAQLEQWAEQKFVGVSLYIVNPQAAAALPDVNDSVWQWLDEHRWLISVNSNGAHWPTWQPILERHPSLRLVASHLGSPPSCKTSPDDESARANLAALLALAKFPSVHVKLSAFYAFSDPGHDYPHQAAWPYVEAIKQAFGVDRLLWGTDFSPCLGWVSFAQAVDVLKRNQLGDLEKIQGGNLRRLLGEVKSS